MRLQRTACRSDRTESISPTSSHNKLIQGRSTGAKHQEPHAALHIDKVMISFHCSTSCIHIDPRSISFVIDCWLSGSSDEEKAMLAAPRTTHGCFAGYERSWCRWCRQATLCGLNKVCRTASTTGVQQNCKHHWCAAVAADSRSIACSAADQQHSPGDQSPQGPSHDKGGRCGRRHRSRR